jgi:phospholipid/cholesterol/gamma-HCH transport system substrate-binding protein
MNKEIKIGVVVFSIIAMLIIGLNYLKGLNLLSSNRVFYSVYEDIGGLQVGSPVLVNGYQVGLVVDIQLLVNQDQNLLVTLNLDEKFNIPVNSVSKIINQDLMGTKAISLNLADGIQFLDEGDTLISSIEGSLQDEVNAQILPLKNKAEELISSVDSVMIVITAILNKDTRNDLSSSLKSLNKTFELMSNTMSKVNSVVDNNDDKVDKIISNLESISSNIEDKNSDVKKILTNFSTISDSLSNAKIFNALQNFYNISERLNNKDNSIGLLMNDDKIYKNLERSTKELSQLIEDIKMHPNRYMNFSIIGGSTPYEKQKK